MWRKLFLKHLKQKSNAFPFDELIWNENFRRGWLMMNAVQEKQNRLPGQFVEILS